MRITQAYVSKSIQDFLFHTIYQLDDYNNAEQPCIFFGCYRYEDVQIINNHRGHRVVFWTGQDILNYTSSAFFLDYAYHVTAHPKVHELLVKEFENVLLVKPASFLNSINPQQLGKKIYAYCPDSAPDYHGKKVIDDLKCAGYEIIIGDGQWTQDQWRNGKADELYNEVGIGLCLSDFAGGGLSIIEMGLRGIPVVTNVFELPNCIPWKDAQDVANIIERERSKIGSVKRSIAQSTWDALDHNHYWLKV